MWQNPHHDIVAGGKTSKVIEDAAVFATIDGRHGQERMFARDAVEALVKKSPEAAQVAMDDLKRAEKGGHQYDIAIALIAQDLKESGVHASTTEGPAAGERR